MTKKTIRSSAPKNGADVSARRVVSRTEAVFAARARVAADKKRGKHTEQWIRDLAADRQTAVG